MKYMLFLSTWCVLNSCIVKKIPLSNKVLSFNPYNINDVLIFQSQRTDKRDTIFILDALQSNVKNDLPNSVVYLGLDLIVYYSKNNFDSAFWKRNSILSLDRSIDNKEISIVRFSINLNNNTWFLSKPLKIDSVYTMPIISCNVSNKVYSDVIVINNAKAVLNSKDASQIYWSLSHGYIKVVKSDGEEYNLINKYNDSIACRQIALKINNQTIER